jgi:hypothetical protein
MHYTGMAAMSVKLHEASDAQVDGLRPLLMIVPITIVTAATIVVMALSALQAMTDEEFTHGAATPKSSGHAEHAWSLKQASAAQPVRRTRPSPSPIPRREKPAEAAAGS